MDAPVGAEGGDDFQHPQQLVNENPLSGPFTAGMFLFSQNSIKGR